MENKNNNYELLCKTCSKRNYCLLYPVYRPRSVSPPQHDVVCAQRRREEDIKEEFQDLISDNELDFILIEY